MKNKLITLFSVIVLCFLIVVPASAAGNHVFINNNEIDAQAVSEFENYAQTLEDKYNYSVLLAIIDGVGDEGTSGYARELYEVNAECENGIALVYNYGDNIYAFYCAGEADALFPEDVQKNTLWYAFAYTETYYEGIKGYFTGVGAILSKNVTAMTTGAQTAQNTAEATTQFVPVERKLPLVVDNADVLQDEEEAVLIARLEEISTANSIEVGIVTVDSCEGKTPQAFADDFYDYNGYGYGENDDGLIVVFNTGKDDGDRNLWISTHGKCIDLITDLEIDVIIEMMIPLIKNGDYVAAFNTFIDETEGAVDTSVPLFFIPVSIVIGFGLAFLIVKIQASKLKSVKQKVDAADYVRNAVITGRYDNFMYKDVKKVPVPKSDSSSTHTSSSGRTHGGGGKSF